MDHKNRLEELNKEAVDKFEEYMQLKSRPGSEEHDKAHSAKNEWQLAWAKLMETLMILERLEI